MNRMLTVSLLSQRVTMGIPAPSLRTYELLEGLACLESLTPYVGNHENEAYFIQLASLVTYFLENASTCADTHRLRNCFVHLVSAAAVQLLQASCPTAPHKDFAIYTASVVRLLHAHTSSESATGLLKGEATRLLLECCKRRHHLTSSIDRIFTYFAEQLLTGDQEVYQAFASHFAQLCFVVMEADKAVQPKLLAAVQSVIYMDDDVMFDMHHGEVVQLLSLIAKDKKASEIHSTLKQAVNAKLLSTYRVCEIDKMVRTASVDTASDTSSSQHIHSCYANAVSVYFNDPVTL